MNRHSFLLLSLASIVFLPGCEKIKEKFQGEQAVAPQMGAPKVTVMVTKPDNITVNTILPGRLEAYRQAEVRARVPGIIMERCYDEGQEVEEGTTLFLIDPAQLIATRNIAKATLKQAQANLESAEDRLERYSKLVNTGAVSERDHTEATIEEMRAKAMVDSAQAELERAELELSYATVVSPIKGRARRALVTEGALVGQDIPTPLTTVEQINPIYVNFSQPATEMSEMRRAVVSKKWKGVNVDDIKVHLIFADGQQYPIDGKFVFADMAVDTTTDTIAMRALFDNPNYELLPGGYVRISFDMAVQENVFLVPRDAVLRTENGPIVLAVNDQNMIVPISVQTDRLIGKNWLVTEGLKGGEKIIVEQVLKMRPGIPAEIGSVVDIDGNPVDSGQQQPASPANDMAAAPRNDQSPETNKEDN